ncbi:MAG: UDP-N-acetylmuramate--L-alanine ligase [Patescibacteria group bacterium]|nr:UDP-N-acetylmuramate--L-alanine ligase [Patescibacteria group bacterium]
MKIHFIGIGGIGVSAIAQYYLAKGHEVSGSDLVLSEVTEFLKKKGINIIIGKHKAENLPKDVGLVIHSPAVQKDNPEFLEANRLQAVKDNLEVLSYPEALGKLTKEYFTIAVSGTHGKSTTSSMIALVLIKAGLDPTVVVGTKLKELGGTNFRMGKSKYLLIEADEWNASFLNYWPKIIVLTSIEEEHLDYYKDLTHILKTYKEYVEHLSEDGILITNKDDKNILKLKSQMLKLKFKSQDYGLEQEEAKKLKQILKIPGDHNILNALATLNVVRILGVADKVSFDALSEYTGVWRRFEIKKAETNSKKFTIISDYAHHPTEVEATLKATKEKFNNKKIWCVFQPHQYQRTYYLFNDFVKVFSDNTIDKLIITDIYDVAGRENKETKNRVSSEKLIQKINTPNAIYLEKEKIVDYLKKNLEGN